MDRHALIHSDEKRYKCESCAYSCRRRQDLPKHRAAMHSGKPYAKVREQRVEDYFRSISVAFRREFVINLREGRPRKFVRLDFLIPAHFGWICFEVDERQHRDRDIGYECSRMLAIRDQLVRRHPHARVSFVRYNPDPYKQGDQIVRPSGDEREAQIRDALAYSPAGSMTVTYLFYAMCNGWPAIAQSADYSLKEYVVRA